MMMEGACMGVFSRFISSIFGEKAKTNADMLLGRHIKVVEDIDPILGCGRVFVDGEYWKAKSTVFIPTGVIVEVKAIDGVSLVVSAIDSI
jgi:membrane protein implicated in regulation of membrane protease activity